MIIDIIVIIALAISALIAFLRGFIREVLTILGVVGASVAAYSGGPVLSPLIKGWLGVVEGEEPQKLFDILPYPLLADMLAYGGLFVVVLIGLSIFSHFISEGAKAIGLGPVDRTLGVIFGLLRGVVLLGLLFLPVHLLVDQKVKDGWFEGSQTYFYLEKVSATMASYLPDSTKEDMEETLEQAKDGNETRKKLQELDLLRQDENTETGSETAPPPPDMTTTPDEKEGYTDDFRDDMDRLFEQKTGQDTNE